VLEKLSRSTVTRHEFQTEGALRLKDLADNVSTVSDTESKRFINSCMLFKILLDTFTPNLAKNIIYTTLGNLTINYSVKTQ